MEQTDGDKILEKEIDLIQSCINRMAQNSFIVKGWIISLITVVFALLPETFNIKILSVVGIIISICFWYLDGFFLKMEKLYRWKYEWVIKKRLSSNEYYYDLNPYNKKMWLKKENGLEKKEPRVIKIMFTKTLIPIYIPIIIGSLYLFIYSYTNWL